VRTYFVLLLRQGGTSFVEMALAVTVLSILTALALPSVYELMNNSTIRSKRHALLQDIRTLRFRAISRRRPAYMCALDSEGICASQTHWNEGWMGYIDNNLNSKYDEGDERVLRQAKLNKSFSVDIIFLAR
jgi:type IV fimbrial biogenesis protein FimT